jgi:hypothetical protein
MRRASEFMEEAATTTGLDVEEFLRQITEDERLSDLFAAAVQSAVATSVEQKRRGLARAVAASMSGGGAEMVDESSLLISAIDELEVPHLELLRAMKEPHLPDRDIPTGTP